MLCGLVKVATEIMTKWVLKGTSSNIVKILLQNQDNIKVSSMSHIINIMKIFMILGNWYIYIFGQSNKVD